jgi:reactive intermediate/imine deaminase
MGLTDIIILAQQRVAIEWNNPGFPVLLSFQSSGGPMAHQIIQTSSAPAAIGPYSQAVKAGQWVFTSGQIGLHPETQALVTDSFEAQVRQAFSNLKAVAEASGGSLADAVKFTLFLTDLGNFATVNAIMQEYLSAPFPARSTVGVASLPKGAQFEIEAVLLIGA